MQEAAAGAETLASCWWVAVWAATSVPVVAEAAEATEAAALC